MRKANSIEEVKKFILCDDLVASGKDVSSLLEFTDAVDSNTTVELLDYGKAVILHHVGDQGRFLSYMPLKVGEEDIFVAKTVKDSGGGRTVRMIGPKCMFIDYVDVIQSEHGAGEGLLTEVMDPYDSTGGKIFGTVMYFPKNNIRSDLYLFMSPIVHKTMYARFQMKTRYISMSRDLGLHQTLSQMKMQAVQESSRPDVNTTLVGCYTVMRGHGKYRKPIATFTKKTCRIPFSKAVCAMTDNKNIECIGWNFSQADGLLANFRYTGIDEAVEKSGIQYRPVIGLRICDSGKNSNRLFIGWYDPENTENPEKSICWVHQYNLQSVESSGQYVINAISDDNKKLDCNEDVWKSEILGDIDTFTAWEGYTETGKPENVVEKFLSLMTFKDVGSKVRSAIADNMIRQANKGECAVTWYTLFQRFVQSMCECSEIDSINDYAKSLLHYNNVHALFADKNHWPVRKLNGISSQYDQITTAIPPSIIID